MEQILSARDARELDARTIAQGLPSAVLMERAAIAVADEICKAFLSNALPFRVQRRVVILSGSGNNGGDGVCTARILAERGFQSTLILCGSPKHKSSELQRQLDYLCAEADDSPGFSVRCLRLHPDFFVSASFEEHTDLHTVQKIIQEADLIVDGLFGIGLNREITGEVKQLIQTVNRSSASVIAIDIPSGINGDTGQIEGAAVRSDCTVTFGYRKTGQVLYPGSQFCGRIVVAPVGFSQKQAKMLSVHPVYSLDDTDLPDLLPVRRPDGNKGHFGKVLLVGGKMYGASFLCAGSILKSGAGMLKIASPKENIPSFQLSLPEAMLLPYSLRTSLPFLKRKISEEFLHELTASVSWADCVVAGPGLTTDPEALELLETVLKLVKEREEQCLLVLDADALNLLSEHAELARLLPKYCTVTPHLAEMARLLNTSVQEVKNNLFGSAAVFARRTGCICVLKDARSLIACEDGAVYLNKSGNDALATAGSGDVLCGLVASLQVQAFLAVKTAADEQSVSCSIRQLLAQQSAVAVHVHGRSAEALSKSVSSRGVTASMLIPEIAARI